MTDWIELDPRYSTTRRVRKVAPEVVEAELKAAHKPEDQFETILFQPEGEGRKGEGGLRTKRYFKKNSDLKPLLTVITVVFNGEKYLEETILSVISQSCDNIEYVIIDGGSTDGTIDIIRKYEHAISYWISEKDHGIYDAMNKGIRLATGSYVHLLNAGDVYTHSNVFSADMFMGDQHDFLCFTVEKRRGGKRDGRIWTVKPTINIKCDFVDCGHPGLIVKKSFYKKHQYDTSYQIAADCIFIYSYVKPKDAVLYPYSLVLMDGEGVSSRFSLRHEIEKIKLLWIDGYRKGERIYVQYLFLKSSLAQLYHLTRNWRSLGQAK